ncbi:enoyl-CoA hydratase/isomerase family protein [Neptunicella marina]|uniref:Enoyl-CoA hydratase/isomerase family protein n=1 Tax=Neptunicella marina TaxID=2125989 RepID=A0A8J6IL42_9ALTE|nr:enoyl-CoA hydratase/isomerase family protein [Neptunicella marina]MBC3764620.1 enoyl-CoA hydratase/isomerase family protein [Neptunicella marina]
MSDALLYSVDKRGVATVTLNRPQKHNAFDDALIAELTAQFKQIAADKTVRVVVLTANGKNFCAGADLGWMQRMAGYSEEENRRDANALAEMLFTLNSLPQPTIARVNGAAFGGAVGLVACCDMAVATKLSQFCLSEVKLGLIPATISPYVIAAIGERQARRYFLTAERFTARRARRLGLVNETVTEEDLEPTVNGLIDSLLQNSPAAIAAGKQLIANVSKRSVDDKLLAYTSEQIAAIRVSQEGQEGLNSFLEKRLPAWRQGQE